MRMEPSINGIEALEIPHPFSPVRTQRRLHLYTRKQALTKCAGASQIANLDELQPSGWKYKHTSTEIYSEAMVRAYLKKVFPEQQLQRA